MGARGTTRERQVRDMLRDDGWVVYRAAGSHGCADLVALRADMEPLLLQIKSDARNPFNHFGPEDRAALIAEGAKAGAGVVLVWWPPRCEPTFIDSPQWPALKDAVDKAEAVA
jgi:Holliday junction resolvase